MALAITRKEHSAADLRREARRTKDTDQARRLLALALVMEGATLDVGRKPLQLHVRCFRMSDHERRAA